MLWGSDKFVVGVPGVAVAQISYHLELDLDAEGFLLNGSHTGGEGLPHAGGTPQGELRAALQPGDGA